MATSKRPAKPAPGRKPSARPHTPRRPAAKPPETFWTIQTRQRQRPPRVFMIGGGGLT